jgi:hypothetical protein
MVSMSLFEVNIMLLILQEICFVVVMLSLSMFICLRTCLLQSLTHVDLSLTVIMLLIPDKSVVYELTTSKSMPVTMIL